MRWQPLGALVRRQRRRRRSGDRHAAVNSTVPRCSALRHPPAIWRGGYTTIGYVSRSSAFLLSRVSPLSLHPPFPAPEDARRQGPSTALAHHDVARIQQRRCRRARRPAAGQAWCAARGRAANVRHQPRRGGWTAGRPPGGRPPGGCTPPARARGGRCRCGRRWRRVRYWGGDAWGARGHDRRVGGRHPRHGGRRHAAPGRAPFPCVGWGGTRQTGWLRGGGSTLRQPREGLLGRGAHSRGLRRHGGGGAKKRSDVVGGCDAGEQADGSLFLLGYTRPH